MKKLVILLVLISIVGFTITGCGSNDETQPGDNEVLESDYKETYQETGAAVEEEVAEGEETEKEQPVEETGFTEEAEEQGQQFEPFDYSPENDVRIDFMEDILENEELYVDMYRKYAMLRMLGGLSEELETFMYKLKEEKGEEALIKFADNGEKWNLIQLTRDEAQSKIEEGTKEMVDSYLRHTRLGDKEAVEFNLSKEMEEQDPIGKVEKYMEDNKIVVEEIIFPETFEDTNYDIFPMRFTYRYVLKGKVDGRPFEKEVVQNFFIGWDWSDGKENSYETIEYIRDVNNEQSVISDEELD